MLTLLREGCVEAAAHWQLLQKKKKNFLDWISFQMFWFFCKNRYTAWCLPYLYMPFGATWHLPVPVKAVEFVWGFFRKFALRWRWRFFLVCWNGLFSALFLAAFFFSPTANCFVFSFGKRGRDFLFFWQHVLDHFNSLFFCTIQSKAKNLEAKLSYKSIKLIHKIFTHKRLNQST